jgi:site-specific recombinase
MIQKRFRPGLNNQIKKKLSFEKLFISHHWATNATHWTQKVNEKDFRSIFGSIKAYSEHLQKNNYKVRISWVRFVFSS